MDLPSNVSRGAVRRVSKELKAMGRKLPKRGWCERNLPTHFPARELCHDRNGYYWVGYKTAKEYRTPGYAGHRSKRKRSR
jgi:hypothetical protein